MRKFFCLIVTIAVTIGSSVAYPTNKNLGGKISSSKNLFLEYHVAVIVTFPSEGVVKQDFRVLNGVIIDSIKGLVVTSTEQLNADNKLKYLVAVKNSKEMLIANYLGHDEQSGVTLLKINPEKIRKLPDIEYDNSELTQLVYLIIDEENREKLVRSSSIRYCPMPEKNCAYLYEWVGDSKKDKSNISGSKVDGIKSALQDMINDKSFPFGTMIVSDKSVPFGVVTGVFTKESPQLSLFRIIQFKDIVKITKKLIKENDG